MTEAARLFLEKGPYLLDIFSRYSLYEHPTWGDTAPIYMITPDGELINTGFYDLEDFTLELCQELSK